MAQFERRVSLAVGVLFLATFAWSLWSSLEAFQAGLESTTALLTLAGGGLMLLAGVAFVVAGVRDQLSVGGYDLEWWRLQSVGYVAIGLYMVLSGLVQAPLSFLGGMLLLGGASIIIFGLIRARAGPPRDDVAV
ncbi:hypothetical protein G6M89_03815 [Natronolimnobius sp. AArcel1]|uniref:hypothetical protein n=1 Tax=Natronolimnobius sp. AArcel1 TaxID=1679093 RepID=UPI0013EE3D2F|nr:hypothetical protein [Natronolimnobius sp. AArcel1]NGM68146.1 hypothetical protein [Natronolimnobius sp. AArcel1]